MMAAARREPDDFALQRSKGQMVAIGLVAAEEAEQAPALDG